MPESLLGEKLYKTQSILSSLIDRANFSGQQNVFIDALAASLEELNAAAAEIQQQHDELITSSQQIAQERQRYQELFNMTPNGYLVTDIHSRIQEANQTAAQLLNLPQYLLVDKPLTTFIESTKLQDFLDLLDQFPQYRQTLELETLICPRHKPPFPALLSVARAYDPTGKLIGLRWLIHDTTLAKQREEKRLELAQQAEQQKLALGNAQLQLSELNKLSKLKSHFLSSVSHELRTPITNIKVALNLLEKCLQKNARSEYLLDILNTECNREIGLINNLLAMQFNPDESPENKLQLLGLIRLSQWLLELLKPFQKQTELRQIQLVVAIEEDLDRLFVDTDLLQLIVNEMLSNAYKYTPENGRITICVRNGDNSCTSRPTQTISITNNGPKIPANQLGLIFENFHRIPSNDLYEYGGTGIGLALVLKFSQQLGATLRVQSSSEATVFSIELVQQTLSMLDMEDAQENFEFVSGVVLSKY